MEAQQSQLSPEFFVEMQGKALEAFSVLADMNHRVLQGLVGLSASAAKEGGEKVVDKSKEGAQKVGEGAKTVANKTAEGAKTVGDKTAEGAKKAGKAVKNAVVP